MNASNSTGSYIPYNKINIGVTTISAFIAVVLLVYYPYILILFSICIILLLIAIWLFAGNKDPRALVGKLMLLTMLRPLPAISGAEFLVARTVDFIWLLLVTTLLCVSLILNRKRLLFWEAPRWISLIILSTIISLLLGPLFSGHSIVLRDVFELYRGPYYMLVLLFASRLYWTENQLNNFFFRPLLIGIWIIGIISALQIQPLITHIHSALEYIYTQKATAYAQLDYGLRMRNSGTFANPNYMAVSLSLIFPFLLANYSITNSSNSSYTARLFAPLTIILALALVLTTGSRTGLTAAVLAIGSYFLLSLFKRQIIKLHFNKIKSNRFAIHVILILGIVLLVPLLGRLERTNSTLKDLNRAGILGINSIQVKYNTSTQFLNYSLKVSPIIGLGPSKNVDNYLGDNQYSIILYRYGLLGLICWLGLWGSLIVVALRTFNTAIYPFQLFMARAFLTVCPVFLVVCLTGAFFDATQIATLLLLLVSVAYSSTRQLRHTV